MDSCIGYLIVRFLCLALLVGLQHAGAASHLPRASASARESLRFVLVAA